MAPMLRGERAILDGKWYQALSAFAEPRIREDNPNMLGGGGEQQTFRLAARYADHLKISTPDRPVGPQTATFWPHDARRSAATPRPPDKCKDCRAPRRKRVRPCCYGGDC